jgi:voltage-gated potassium channel
MNSATSMILRQMRLPLVVLVVAYAVSILGLVLIPGVDDQGRPWQMDFLHAFYFVSYMATTIGFGEIPYPFTPGQRLWVMVTIYITVIAWIYAIGVILSLVQNHAFRSVIRIQRLQREVKAFRRRFYLVCGCGDTGSILVRALTSRRKRAVVVDIDPQRVAELEMSDQVDYVPALCGDAALPENLISAGLLHPRCAGLIALTNHDQANLAIAIAGKLLRPNLPVICRSESHETEANMASFSTDHIVDPFDSFAEHLAMAIHSSGVWLLHEWLTSMPNSDLTEPLYPPRGLWVVCGYGRFGKAVNAHLRREGIDTVVIEAHPQQTSCHDCVVGSGAEARTLLEAGIDQAVGIVAGTNDDHTNLSIVMTAIDINSELFVVMRQNRSANDLLFGAIHADLVMQASGIIAHEMLALLTEPLLARFLYLARKKDNDWANPLLSRISGITPGVVPSIWEIAIEPEQTNGLWQLLRDGEEVTIGDLLRDPRQRDCKLPIIPLLHARGFEFSLVPDESIALDSHDRVLFCGMPGSERSIYSSLQNYNAASYVVTGRQRPDGVIWRWVEQHWSKPDRQPANDSQTE